MAKAFSPEGRAKRVFLAGTLLFFVSIVLVNCFGAQWFNFDMYADARVAGLMAEQKSFFPDNWIFGNQYYLAATPNLAALLCLLTGDCVLATGIASSLMFLGILLAYRWCCRPIFSGGAAWVGLFCLGGACILGNSASSCNDGLLILATMASFYACYVLAILLHLGICIRLLQGTRVSPPVLILACLFGFALGMQSLRETLVLFLPLVILTGAAALRKRTPDGKRCFLFSVCGLLSNAAGTALSSVLTRSLHIRQESNLTGISLSSLLAELGGNAAESLRAFLQLIGLGYLHEGWKWKPLALLGLFFLALVLAALLLSRKTPFARRFPLLFCGLSLLLVFLAGVSVLHVRGIYFFVWYLLVPFSASFLADRLSGSRRRLLLICLLLCGAASYVYNFYPDLRSFAPQRAFYREINDWMWERGVEEIYGDYQAPTIAATSGGERRFTSVFPNLYEEDGALLVPYVIPCAKDGYLSVDPDRAVLVLSDAAFDEASGYRSLGREASDAYRSRFDEAFTLEKVFASPHLTYYVYSFRTTQLFAPDRLRFAG